MVKVAVACTTMPTHTIVCMPARGTWGLLDLKIASEAIWDKISLHYYSVVYHY